MQGVWLAPPSPHWALPPRKQWHWAAAEPPAEALHDGKILGKLLMRLRELYREEGGVCPEPLMNINWNYQDPEDPTPEEIAREGNGMALADVYDDKGTLILKKGQQLADFSRLRDDGTTASFCWIYAGSRTEKSNQMANRDNSDAGLGLVLAAKPPHPVQPRLR